MTNEQLHELLNRACAIIDSLEGYAKDHPDYQGSHTQRCVDAFFNDVDHLNEEDTGPEYDSAGFTEEDRIVDGQYRNYVNTVKENIDRATAEGILKSGTECVSYSYMSKEGFAKRIKTDQDFAAQWADLEAQDYDTFGNNKI